MKNNILSSEELICLLMVFFYLCLIYRIAGYINFFYLFKNVNSKNKLAFYPSIALEKMMDVSPKRLDESSVFKVGFAAKVGFYNLSRFSPITHTALAFYNEKENKWLILGRQSLSYNKVSFYKSSSDSFFSLFSTKVDNENNYDFFAESPFKVSLSTVELTGKEIMEIIKKTNKEICKQFLTFYNSNCNSASVYMLAEIIKLLHSNNGKKEQADIDISMLYEVLKEAATQNFALGIANNYLVRKAIEEVHQILQARVLFETPEEKHSSYLHGIY